MKNSERTPKSVWVGLALAILLDTVIQITWKSAVDGIPETASLLETARATLGRGSFYLAMVGFGAQLLNWTKVLSHADLSFAQPFTALGFISVLVVSTLFLHEPVTALKCIGVTLILVGVFFISRTPHRTSVAEKTL